LTITTGESGVPIINALPEEKNEEMKACPLDVILLLLEDREWHDIADIIKKSGLSEKVASTCLNFLVESGLIEVDLKEDKAKASKAYLDFTKRIAGVER